MSYVTLEVAIEHGRIVPKDPSRLPEKGSGLLTILKEEENGQSQLTPLQALEALQRHLGLDAKSAENWAAAVNEARR